MFRQNTYISFLKKSFGLLDPRHKQWSYKVLALTIVNSFVEVLGLALVIPILYLVNDPTPIHNNKWINGIYSALPFKEESTFVLFLLGTLLVIFILKNLFSTFAFYVQSKFTFSTALSLIERQSKQFLKRPFIKVTQENSNYSLRNIAIYPEEFASYVLMPIISITNELLVLGLIVLGLIVYSVKIFFLLCLTLLPISFIILKITKDKAYKIGTLKNEFRPKSFKQVFEMIFSFTEIKLFKSEHFFVKRVKSTFKRLYEITVKERLFQILPQRIIETIIILAIVLLYAFIVVVMKSSLNELILVLILFATAAYRVMPSLDRVLQSLILMKSNHYVFDSLLPYSVKKERLKQTHITAFNDSIKLENVSYTYSGKTESVLDKVNLNIERGTIIGLIGASGEGKSTLVKVLSGLVNKKEGKIIIDGMLMEPSYEWTSLIAYVSQDPYLLDASLVENIAFGLEEKHVDYTLLNKSLAMSGLSDFVANQQDGIHCKVGEFGLQISGGQKQRIAIARALYKQAQILIMDEALNAIDESKEQELLSSLLALKAEGKTIVMIAHKKDSLKICDKVYQLKDKRLNLV